MVKDNMSIDQYDIDIMKKNIKQIMKDNGITQTKLGELTGIDQPRISAVLNGKSSECFTICQLANISKALHVSTDTLLGIKSTKETKADITLADICKKLFDIDEILTIKLGNCETDEIIGENFLDIPPSVFTDGIYFDNDILQNILKEWREYKSINTHNPNTKKKIIQTWKKETLKDAEQRRAIWRFRNLNEQRIHLANCLIAGHSIPFNEIDFELLSPDNIDILKAYMDSGEYVMDFLDNPSDMALLEKAYSEFSKKNL